MRGDPFRGERLDPDGVVGLVDGGGQGLRDLVPAGARGQRGLGDPQRYAVLVRHGAGAGDQGVHALAGLRGHRVGHRGLLPGPPRPTLGEWVLVQCEREGSRARGLGGDFPPRIGIGPRCHDAQVRNLPVHRAGVGGELTSVDRPVPLRSLDVEGIVRAPVKPVGLVTDHQPHEPVPERRTRVCGQIRCPVRVVASQVGAQDHGRTRAVRECRDAFQVRRGDLRDFLPLGKGPIGGDRFVGRGEEEAPVRGVATEAQGRFMEGLQDRDEVVIVLPQPRVRQIRGLQGQPHGTVPVVLVPGTRPAQRHPRGGIILAGCTARIGLGEVPGGRHEARVHGMQRRIADHPGNGSGGLGCGLCGRVGLRSRAGGRAQ